MRLLLERCPWPTNFPDVRPRSAALVEPDGVNFSVYSRSADRLELLLYDHVDDSRSHPGSSDWIRATTAPITTGMCSFRTCDPASSTPTGPTARPIRLGASSSIQPRCCSTRMVGPSPLPRTISGAKRADRGRMTGMLSRAWLPMSRRTTGKATHTCADLLRRPSSTKCTSVDSPSIPARVSTTKNAARMPGVIEKIPYLQDLGITAVELLPVFQFDWQDAPAGLTNYWGYAPGIVLRSALPVQLLQ